MCAGTHACVSMHMYVCLSVHMHVRVHTQTQVHLNTDIHMCTMQAAGLPPDPRGTYQLAGTDPHDSPAESPQPAGRQGQARQLHR